MHVVIVGHFERCAVKWNKVDDRNNEDKLLKHGWEEKEKKKTR